MTRLICTEWLLRNYSKTHKSLDKNKNRKFELQDPRNCFTNWLKEEKFEVCSSADYVLKFRFCLRG